jgi:hypothetical protein
MEFSTLSQLHRAIRPRSSHPLLQLFVLTEFTGVDMSNGHDETTPLFLPVLILSRTVLTHPSPNHSRVIFSLWSYRNQIRRPQSRQGTHFITTGKLEIFNVGRTEGNCSCSPALPCRSSAIKLHEISADHPGKSCLYFIPPSMNHYLGLSYLPVVSLEISLSIKSSNSSTPITY